MEPIGLALTRQPLSLTVIIFFVVVAAAVFIVASRTGEGDKDEED